MSEEQEAPQEAGPAMIEREKFDRVVAAKRGLEQQVAELRETNQALEERTSSVDALAAQLDEARAAVQDAAGKFDRYRSISSAVGSTDPDVIEAFEWQYGRMGADERPALPDWINGLKKSPGEAPAVLRPWLESKQATPEPQQQARRPSPSAGHKQPPGASSAYSNEEMRRIRQDALMTGDWSEWQRVRKEMGLSS